MPLSEFHQMAKGKLESSQSKMNNCSIDQAFVPDHDFVELVWENGQILMQGQSSKTRRSPSSNNLPSYISKVQDKDGGDATNLKIGRSRTEEHVLNDFTSTGPSGNMGLASEEEMVPWLNYSLDDSLQHDYCSEFFSELTGVNLNALSTQNNSFPIDKNSSCGQISRDLNIASVYFDKNPQQGNASKGVGGSPEPIRPSSNQLRSSSLQQCQISLPSLRPRVSDLINSNTNNADKASCGNSSDTPTSNGGLPNTKMQRQDPGPTRPPLQNNISSGLMNFSHFSRPAAFVKANLHNLGAVASPGLSSIDNLRSNGKVSAAGNSNPVESTLIDSTSGSRNATSFLNQRASVLAEGEPKPSISKPPKEQFSAENSEVVFREEAHRRKRSPDRVIDHTSSFAASTAIGKPDGEGAVEPAVASSSVCSVNSGGGASDDPKNTLKRKSRDGDESEYQSEDLEEESVGVKKLAPSRGGTSAKRSRAAEVHNLSERRRRDRINEKMRALQELIPNCNKVDKASMLDEAIEYLKTLQLQVQIMSMGSGLCMPPMMLPPGMQHLHMPHLAHFSPMGVGMGMGMGMGLGFGMGMVDMSSGSSDRPLIQVPSMHGRQFPCPPISGPASLPGMAGANLQMFGLPSQGLPMSIPRAPIIPLSGGSSTKSISLPDTPGTVTPVKVPDSAPPSSSKEPEPNINPQMMHKTTADCSPDHISTQCQATKESFEESAFAQRNKPTQHTSVDGVVDSTKTNGTI